MPDNDNQLINLTRRQMLAGVGAVGLASAGAGLGTSALFRDTESFTGNSIVAGELDLLVDWQQHYEYFDGGMKHVFVNAHPDHDGDGEQSIEADNDAGQLKYSDFPDPNDPESIGANIPGLGCGNIPPLTEAAFGEDPFTGESMDTLVQLRDVKPGDMGEITFSLHLCDNPGYIWMQAGNVSQDGGTATEPELIDDPDNLGTLGDAIQATLWYDEDCDNVYDPAEPADIMLTLDFSGSMLYRRFGGVVSEAPIQMNGDSFNETTKIDLVELGVLEFVDFLQAQNADVKVGVAYFDGSQSDDPAGTSRTGILQPMTTDLSQITAAVGNLRQKLANVVSGDWPTDPLDGDGDPDPDNGAGIAEGTYIGEGVNAAQTELANEGRAGASKSNIVLSDGQSFNGQSNNQFISPIDAAADARLGAGDGGNDPATDLYTISVGEADDATLLSMAGAAGTAVGSDNAYFADVDDPNNIPVVFGNLAARFGGEEIIIQDTLANVLAELADGNGIPLDGNRGTLYDELEEPANDPDRDAYPASNGFMHCVALKWELPADVGNEVQGDTIGFDLGFYTEQERNNDGSGPAPA
ncbi:SipW-dependent-type signal peptide-containing protein [Haloglomus litoreum]|uniref:SipW-dependent-type signal peptide-containing protein n=1 Tax=Haloglomus litoreum TaxID=3034026 RepID=UPI0023E76EC6|nr:vWA domain-containing protein [Haloglomus sp. DT116]